MPNIVVKALSQSSAEIMIYEQIGVDYWTGGGVTAQKFAADLKALGPVAQITVRMNSPGGNVFDGLAIYNLLKAHGAVVTVYVDGLAASIASVIAMAASPGQLFMADNAMMMIHDPSTLVEGNATQMRATAEVLDQIKAAMMTSYVSRTGMNDAEIGELMTAETWFTAAQARELTFADEVISTATETEAPTPVEAKFDLSRFRNVPVAMATTQPTARPTIEENAMPEVNPTAVAAEIQAATDKARREAVDAEKARRADIRAVFTGSHAVDYRDMLDSALEDMSMSAATVSAKLLKKLGEDATPSGTGRVEAGIDARDKFVAGAANAILARHGVEKADPQNEFNGMGLSGLIRASLRNNGVSGTDRLQGASLASKFFAMSTSDFPLILANTANKAMRKAYDAQPSTWKLWCDVGTVTDFKSNSRLQVGTFNSLATIPEGGEYTYGSFSEQGETIQASTKGKGLALTRQLIINDDLGVFVSRAQKIGFAAARTINEDVYAYLQANGNTADGGALFNATAESTAGGHANYTASGTAISNASIGVGDALMGKHKDPDKRTFLNIMPKYLIVPRALKQTAWQLLNAVNRTDPSQSNPNAVQYAQSLDLTLVVDANLDAGSATAWYLVADQNLVPLIEVAFLDGVQTPYTDEAVDWDTDALRMKVRLDYGVSAIDWRAGYKNTGA